MEPSKQVNRRTNKKDLGKKLNSVAKEGLASHNKQVLSEYYLDYETTGTETKTEDLMIGSQEWTWMTLPQISGMVPWLVFLYGGKFTFEDQVEIKKSLEVYDCPMGCKSICLREEARVLVIYK